MHTKAAIPTIVQSQCPFCSVQCKMQIETIQQEGEAEASIKVEGLMNKASEGRLCVKGMNAYQHATSKERITQPLMKKNGMFVQVTWEEAITAIGSQFTTVRKQHGADAVGVYGGGSLTNETAYLLGKFARVALQTRYIDYNGRFCMSAAASAGVKTFGVDRGLTNRLDEIPHSECIILAGTNIAECQPTLMPYFTKAKENGTSIIVIDPRRTGTAELADLHLKVKPGTDAILASGLLKAIVEIGGLNEPFIRDRTSGFEAIVDQLKSIELSEVAEATGIPEKDIRLAATLYSKANTGMIFTARGVEQHADGHIAVRNFLNLALATGKIGREGCGYGAVTGQGNGQGGREHGQKADQLPGYRLIENEQDREHIAKVWGIAAAELPRKGVSAYEMMELIHEGTLKSLFIMGSNPIVSNPNAGFVEEGIRNLDFLVVADMFMSETAKLAHIVLPVTSYLENEGTMTNLEGRVLLRRKAFPAPEGTLDDWHILCLLAEQLGKGDKFDFSSAEQIFEELRIASQGGIADYYGITYERLLKEEGVYWPCPSPEHPGTARLFEERFAHPDGRAVFAELITTITSEQTEEEFPIILTNGRFLPHYLTGVQTRRSPTLIAREVAAVLEIHPRTAQKYRIADGALVEVQSKRGSFIVRSRYTSAIREDTVFAPMHWGGLQNVNLSTNPLLDPNCKMPDFKACAVSIRAYAD